MAVDADFDKVALLLHFDGANGSTTFADSALVPNTVTTYGGVVISTAQSKWGGASAYFDGTNYSYAAIQNSIEFDLAHQDFTIDAWVYFIASGPSGAAIFGRWGIGPSTNTDFVLAIEGGKLVFIAGGTGGVALDATGALPGGAWVHVAVTRSGNVWTLWQGGVAVAAQTSAFAIPYSPLRSLRISCWDDPLSFFRGYIDDLRITKGVARYTANFTPPTEPFPNTGAAYALSGTVTGSTGSPAARAIRAIREDTGAYVGGAISDGVTGAFAINTEHPGEHTLVAYPVTGENLPALVHRGVIPI